MNYAYMLGKIVTPIILFVLGYQIYKDWTTKKEQKKIEDFCDKKIQKLKTSFKDSKDKSGCASS